MLGAEMTENAESQFDDFSGDGNRLWVVSLRLRSAARFLEDKNLHLISTPESTASVCGVKIRNMRYNSSNGGTHVTGLTFEAAGQMSSSTEAASTLANLAYSYVQVAALTANAAFSDDFEMLVYAPPTDNLPGRFHTQKSCIESAPAPRLRAFKAEEFLEVMTKIREHGDEERLHRAMAHFRLALNYLDPFSWVLAAEHLFIATENLQRVVFKRLCISAGLPINGASKHQLAIKAGFEPDDETNAHLSNFDSFIRMKYIFQGDSDCYKGLKFASDHFEHGSRAFNEVRKKADAHAKKAFGHIRKAILFELGVDPSSTLFKESYDEPAGAWHPQFEICGSYSHPGCDLKVELEPEQIGKNWPPFHGLNMHGHISDIVDDDESKRRTITFIVTGNGASLVEDQRAEISGTRWVLPEIKHHEFKETDPDVQITVTTKHE